MKALLAVGGLFIAASLYAQSNYQVDLVIPAKKYLFVDGSWQKGADCIEARVSVDANTASREVVAKAYFFSTDGTPLHTEDKPASEGKTDGTTLNPMPAQFERGQKYSVLFPIPTSINTGSSKWKRAIVVFGSGDDFAIKIYPKDDLSIFSFPEKPKSASLQVHSQPPNSEGAALDPKLATLQQGFQAAVERDALNPRNEAIAALGRSYTAALDRALAAATKAGRLTEAVALRDEKARIENGQGVPTVEEETAIKETPDSIKTMRRSYRATLMGHDGLYARTFQSLANKYDLALSSLQTELTKANQLDDALRVKATRDELANARTDGGRSLLASLAKSPSVHVGAASGVAFPTAVPFTNTLGMKFVAVPGAKILMCVHETRKKDYAAFAGGNPKMDSSWKNPKDKDVPTSTGDDHPVVMVTLDEATAFCAWLSKREKRTYRLPTDREWSIAVGIGDREAPDATPAELQEKIRDEYPWGSEWPPPKGAGNIRDTAFQQKFPNEKLSPPEGYTDGFATTAPVMSFSPNKLGIYDLEGNGREFCSDWFDKNKSGRVARGGGYGSVKGGVISSFRVRTTGERSAAIGFRCVVEAP